VVNFGNCTTISFIFSQFSAEHTQKGQNSTSDQNVNPKFEIPMAVSYSNTNFGGASTKIYTCFEQKWLL